MFYRSTRYPNEVHFYAALLEAPEAVKPQAHFHSKEQLVWLHLSDTLPRR